MTHLLLQLNAKNHPKRVFQTKNLERTNNQLIKIFFVLPQIYPGEKPLPNHNSNYQDFISRPKKEPYSDEQPPPNQKSTYQDFIHAPTKIQYPGNKPYPNQKSADQDLIKWSHERNIST